MASRFERLPELGSLFPGCVATAVGIPGRIAGRLFDVESETVARATPARQLEFAAGRFCAREALARLDFIDTPLPRRDDRRPVWPDGVVGSISHSRGICGAAVACSVELAGIGLDVEVADACPPELAQRVLTPAERERVATLEGSSDTGLWRTMIFSAKESVYKAVSGFANVREFEDVEVAPLPEENAFIATLLDGQRLRGRFRHFGGWVLTGVVVPTNGFNRKELDSVRSGP